MNLQRRPFLGSPLSQDRRGLPEETGFAAIFANPKPKMLIQRL